MSGESNRSINEGEKEEHTWSEEIELAASELVDKTKELIEEGNVRRLIIRNQDDEVLLEVPLTAGVAVGGVVTLLAPVLAAIGAMEIVAVLRFPVVREGGVRGEGDQALTYPEEIYAMLRVPPQDRLQLDEVFPHQCAHLLCVAEVSESQRAVGARRYCQVLGWVA